jgi:hypothetical protein
MVWFLQDLQ